MLRFSTQGPTYFSKHGAQFDMTSTQMKCILLSSLAVGPALGLGGCLEEDEPNDGPETAYWNNDHPFQSWTGDDNLPFPNGNGTLVVPPGPLSIGDLDSWPVSVYSANGQISHFQGTLWMSPGANVLLAWRGWVHGELEEAVWDWVEPYEYFPCPGSEPICTTHFTVPVTDAYHLYSLEVFGEGNYGFILVPVFE